MLSSGEWIEHDVYEATRLSIFATELTDWPVASIGGTIFLCRYRERLFAISARHILGHPQFEPSTLIIHERNREPTGRKLSYLYATTLEIPLSEAEGGADDAFDLVVWEYEASGMQNVQAYYWDSETVSEANPGAVLFVVGYLFDKTTLSSIDANTGTAMAQVAKFGFYHVRQAGDDQSAMRGVARYPVEEARSFGSFRGAQRRSRI